ALQEAGFATQAAADGAAAADAALARSFDLCISDIRMPVANGLELMQRLAASSPETIVMLMTAHGDLDSALAALRLGAVAYLVKPFRHEELIAKVHHLAEHRRLLLENRSLRRAVELG